jgi:hypothetical protein
VKAEVGQERPTIDVKTRRRGMRMIMMMMTGICGRTNKDDLTNVVGYEKTYINNQQASSERISKP